MKPAELIARAERAARRLRAPARDKSRAGHSIYVVLLHDPRMPERWGLYVGQTSRDPDWRFDQHKTGFKASGAVKRFGVQLLPQVVRHLNPLGQAASLDLEAMLADAFRAAGICWVEGGH